MPKPVRILLVFVCLMVFLFVRFRESEIFYDPLISFFKGYYQTAELPELNMPKLLLHITYRFGIHMVVSLAILWFVFLEKGIIKFATLIYGITFILLAGIFVLLLTSYEVGQATTIFYVRRFLIQPLLIFILLPAFFYYRKVNT